jgi:hypothetical protein
MSRTYKHMRTKKKPARKMKSLEQIARKDKKLLDIIRYFGICHGC